MRRYFSATAGNRTCTLKEKVRNKFKYIYDSSSIEHVTMTGEFFSENIRVNCDQGYHFGDYFDGWKSLEKSTKETWFIVCR